MTLGDCDFFAAVVGAGSFTGIRIGISAVKGFCAATGKPALPITSFDVAAYNTIDSEDVGENPSRPKRCALSTRCTIVITRAAISRARSAIRLRI